ncbi:hypothetical protein M0804_011600 [Polistes exclamans]|nr:hypothetical protein M0804_011600 [Polistes exclamans]
MGTSSSGKVTTSQLVSSPPTSRFILSTWSILLTHFSNEFPRSHRGYRKPIRYRVTAMKYTANHLSLKKDGQTLDHSLEFWKLVRGYHEAIVRDAKQSRFAKIPEACHSSFRSRLLIAACATGAGAGAGTGTGAGAGAGSKPIRLENLMPRL